MRKLEGLFTWLYLGLLTACATTLPSSVPSQTAAPFSEKTAAPISTSLPSCETHTASVTLSSSETSISAGDSLKVVVTLNNEGCVALGVPQYTLYVSTAGSKPVAIPTNPEPVVHYLAIDSGQSDSAEFDFQTVAAGWVEFTASTSFEVHLGYPGPAYWGSSNSREPLRVLVVSTATETPASDTYSTSERIAEPPLTITFPSGYALTKSHEMNRRGSFASYDFTSLQEYKTPYLKEIQFFSAKSIEEFAEDCMGPEPCFFGDYPNLERYYGQLKAYREHKNFQHYALIPIGENYYFVSNHPCEGDTCLIREYTTFILNDMKVDIWVVIENETQIAQSDELLLSVKLQE